MKAPVDDLIRLAPIRPITETRADESADSDVLATLDITFARFGVWNEIDSWYEGLFLERLDNGSFTKTMAERREQIRCLFDNGYDPQIGNKVLGDITDLGERTDGPFMVTDLFDTSYGRDLLPGLKKSAYGASYRFRVVKEEWDDDPGVSDHNPKGIPERTIKEVKLYEAGPVTFPADEGTSIGVRSLTDRFLLARGISPADARQSLALEPRPDAALEPQPPADEPPTRHSDAEHLTVHQALARLAEIH